MDRKLPPLKKVPADLSQNDGAYSREVDEEYLDNPERFSEKFPYPTHHYN